MSSTYDSVLNLELMADGENSNTWGDKTNVNLQKIAQSIDGWYTISLTGAGSPYTLSNLQGALDESCRNSYNFIGTLTSAMGIRIPSRQKRFIAYNNTIGGFTITISTSQNSVTTVTLNAGDRVELICDGSNVFYAVTGIGGGQGLAAPTLAVSGNATIGGSLAVTGATTLSTLALGTALAITQGGTGAIAQTGSTLPSGMIAPFAGTVSIAGWIYCNGQAVSRTGFANLFAAIGTAFGVGDGSTTFNVPNFSGGLAPIGDGGGFTVGGTGGVTTVGLTTSNMPSHNHGGVTSVQSVNHIHSGFTDAETSDHTHSGLPATGGQGAGGPGAGSTAAYGSGTISSGIESAHHIHAFNTEGVSADHTHTITAQGSGTTFSIQNPYLVVKWYCKT